MISLFKEKSAASVLGLIIFSILLHFPFIYHPPQVIISPMDGLLYYVILPLKALPSIALSIIYQLIILLQAFRFNYILENLKMYPKPTYIGALAFILLTGLFPQWGNISVVLVANSAILWFLFFISKSYNAPKPGALVFNAGLTASIAILLNYQLILLIPASFIALAIIRPFKINEWFIISLGIILPFYFSASYLFITDNMAFAQKLILIFQWHLIVPENLILTLTTIGISSIILICGIYMMQDNSSRMVLQARKTWAIIFFLLIMLIPSIFFMAGHWPYTLLPLLIPASAFISYALIYPRKNIVSLIFFWLLIGLSVYNNWLSLK